MDSVYKGQRHIYDFTRKYYLFGRDTLIEHLDARRPGMRVLEIACGTGRNLAKIGKRWPEAQLYGLDISSEMLKSARDAVGDHARLGLGDACTFDPAEVFDEPGLREQGFDIVVLSYSLSMIPDWGKALSHAAAQVAPGGRLMVVDFGSLEGLPRPVQSLLHRWLAKFHVEARRDLPQVAADICRQQALGLETMNGKLDYFQLHTLTRGWP